MMKKKPVRRGHAIAKESEMYELFAELKGEYLESFPEKVEAIRQFWETGNREGLYNEFHKMKGTGTTYGLPDVTDIAEILEDLCIHDSPKLGACVVVGLELLGKICQCNKFNMDYDLHKDPLFKRLQDIYATADQKAS